MRVATAEKGGGIFPERRPTTHTSIEWQEVLMSATQDRKATTLHSWHWTVSTQHQHLLRLLSGGDAAPSEIN